MEEVVPALEPPSRFPFVSLIAGIPCVLVPLMLCVDGYGAYMRSFFFCVIPAVIALSFVPLYIFRVVRNLLRGERNRLPTSSKWDKVLLLIFLGLAMLSWISGKQVRIWHCESKCRAAEPAIQILRKYQMDHGSYPSQLLQVPEFTSLAERAKVSIREGRDRYGASDVGFFEGPDMIVYLSPGDYLCVVPIERPFIMSITRFYVLRRNSITSTWSEDYFIWTLSFIRHRF
jgi:hypothetical protein